MDIQQLFNGQVAKIRQDRLSNSSQLLMGELKLKLEGVQDKSKPIIFDFGMKPAGASSWRGAYQELGLEYSKDGGGSASWNSDEVEYESDDGQYKSYKSETVKLPENPTTQEFLNMLEALTDKEMVGYKGGDFKMSKNVAVYFGNYGDSTVDNYKEKEYATVAPFDLVENEKEVVIETQEVEY